ncbi:MAG TPA: gamma-glutamylcyclotransferase family protein [Gallionella sp.]|nr:gamma-glutamylcyclotransferase family protein [Gallionella sp.]
MANPIKNYLFVYGTLRRDGDNDMYKLLARHARFLCDGWFNGKLYNVTYYPCAVPSDIPEDKVYGEVYELLEPEYILQKLDDYEECSEKFPPPREYRREIRSIHIANDDVIDAWIYIYNYDVGNLRQIKSGDFFNQ